MQRQGWRALAELHEASWAGLPFAVSSVCFNRYALHVTDANFTPPSGRWHVYLLTILYVVFINIGPSASVNPFSLWLKSQGVSVSKIVSCSQSQKSLDADNSIRTSSRPAAPQSSSCSQSHLPLSQMRSGTAPESCPSVHY